MSIPSSTPLTTDGENWTSQFVQSLREQCERMRDSFVQQQTQWEQAEAELDRRIEHLIEELDIQQSGSASRIIELKSYHDESAARIQELEAKQNEHVLRIRELEAQLLEARSNDESAVRIQALEAQQSESVLCIRDLESQLLEARNSYSESVARIQELEAQQSASASRIQELETQLIESQNNAADLQTAVQGNSTGEEDYVRRYEMALDDLRELKTKNAELQQQIVKLRSAPASAPVSGRVPGGILDWEAEKARILAMLEGESEPSAERHSERIEIEEVIRTTDQVIAEKDRQIEELKTELAESSQTEATANTIDPAALNAILDADTVVREERAKLQQLQREWEDKLRLGEIELSLERAKLGRERAELDGRHCPAALESNSNTPESTAKADKPARGKWLARLGLSETDVGHGPKR